MDKQLYLPLGFLALIGIIFIVVFSTMAYKVFKPRDYIEVCFQRVNEQVVFAVAVPAEYCGPNDRIINLEVAR